MIGEIDRRIREAVRLSWRLQRKENGTRDTDQVEKQIRFLVDRALGDIKEDASLSII
jgi:hypothetical protein